MNKKLKNNQIKFYKKYGYLIVKNVLNNVEVTDINRILKLLEKKQPVARGITEPGIKKSLIHSIHKNKSFIKKIEKKNWFQSFCAGLLGSKEVSVWNAKANLKKKWYGTAEYYHQDLVYWKDRGYPKNEMLSAMIFLDPHNINNAAPINVPNLVFIGEQDIFRELSENLPDKFVNSIIVRSPNTGHNLPFSSDVTQQNITMFLRVMLPSSSPPRSPPISPSPYLPPPSPSPPFFPPHLPLESNCILLKNEYHNESCCHDHTNRLCSSLKKRFHILKCCE